MPIPSLLFFPNARPLAAWMGVPTGDAAGWDGPEADASLAAAIAQVPEPPRIAEAAGLLHQPDLVAREEAALRRLPCFAARYHARGPLSPLSPPDAAPGSVGHTLAGFLRWYDLQPAFFPTEPGALDAMGPLAFAAHMLAVFHDVLHVLAGYDTHDHDEVSLQSMLFGQAPLTFARFIATVQADPELATAGRFKHLRDLLDCRLDAPSVARGLTIGPLLDVRFEALWHEPIPRARERLQIAPRPAASFTAPGRNTCGGRSDQHYFASAEPGC